MGHDHGHIRPADTAAEAAPACSLDREALAERLEDWAALRVRALISQRREGRVVTSTWQPTGAVRDELLRLIWAEHRCCPFLVFELVEEQGAMTLQTTFPEGVSPDIWHSIG
jgi:hypothetical protein